MSLTRFIPQNEGIFRAATGPKLVSDKLKNMERPLDLTQKKADIVSAGLNNGEGC